MKPFKGAQLGDVYTAGMSDGAVQLENKTLKVPNEGFEHTKGEVNAEG